MATPAESKVLSGTHSDFFLKIGDIKGESQDSKHKGEIDLVTWQFGAIQPGASAIAGAGAGSGKVQFQDIELTKYVDSATAKLLLACASGQHIPKATLTCRRAGGTQAEYLKIDLENVLVSSHSTVSHHSLAGVGESVVSKFSLPVEKLTLNFAKITINYKAQNTDGTEGANTQAGWDLKQNLKV
jgi:type VI secretion system secreted protein Hcp